MKIDTKPSLPPATCTVFNVIRLLSGCVAHIIVAATSRCGRTTIARQARVVAALNKIGTFKASLSKATLTLALAVGWALDAVAITIRDDVPVAQYNNLATANAFQAAGFVGDAGLSGVFCSGTLLTPTLFLTAAHCVDGNRDGTLDFAANTIVVGFDVNLPVTLPANNVLNISVHPRWALPTDGSVAVQSDLAVFQLAAPFPGITPASISLSNPLGHVATMIGYGGQSNGLGQALSGANDRLGAQNRIDQNTPDTIVPLLLADFDAPDGSQNSIDAGGAFPLGLEGLIAGGDSGGPLFVEFGGQQLLAGVASRTIGSGNIAP